MVASVCESKYIYIYLQFNMVVDLYSGGSMVVVGLLFCLWCWDNGMNVLRKYKNTLLCLNESGWFSLSC